jgi:biotin carboxylase
MKRPIVIVEPISAGVELAPAFNTHGIPCVAVMLGDVDWTGYGSDMISDDFIKVLSNHPEIASEVKSLNPIAIIPGSEGAVELADSLATKLTPNIANTSHRSLHRRHKALMQESLNAAGIPSIKTLDTKHELEVEHWIKENNFYDTPLIVKPPMSAGSDKIFHIDSGNDWREAFRRVLTEPAKLGGTKSESAVIQEQVNGTEYAIGCVSAKGKHYLAHLIEYTKSIYGNSKTVYDRVELIDCTGVGDLLFNYSSKVLDALGIRWGATHVEVMMTNSGPRLIEVGARICGGPVHKCAKAATGSSQIDRLVQAYAYGDVLTKEYAFKKTVMPVFLRSPRAGRLNNAEILASINKLPTLLDQFIWFKSGDMVPHTIDYLTNLGIVTLTGVREDIIRDYNHIRSLEAGLVIAAPTFP